MDEGSGYCGGGIESVSDAAKIMDMFMTGAGEGCVFRNTVSKIRNREFWQTGWALWVWW